MRRSPLAIAALASVIGAVAAEAQTPLKIGYINSQEVLANTTEAAAAQQQFDAEMQGYQTEIQQLETELTGLQESLQRQQLTLSPDARAAREQQLQARVAAYQQRTQQLTQIAEQRRAELIQPVMDRINTIIETVRAEGQYHLILDLAAGSIIAADPTLDLTQQVIARLGTAAGAAPGQP
ncbi:MAG: OmpH family outer membrane protein [Gemmatimonadota bacterium]|nr:OmpH family outer membrane protein [Gemmatimonadota bacterium]